MKGENHVLAVTTKTLTSVDDPTIPDGEVRREPLFAFPVQICKATDARKSKFDIAAPSGATRTQVYRDDATGEIVSDDECLRGVRVGDEFRPIPAEAITEAKGQKSNVIIVEGKKPLSEIDFTRSEGSYYVQSPVKGGSAKAYRLVYEALATQRGPKGKVTREPLALVTKRTARTNEKLAVIFADEDRKCLKLVQLCFADSVREPDEQVLAPMLAQVEQKQIDVATQVIDTLADADGFLDTARDENIDRIDALLDKAVAGETIKAPEPIAATVEADDLEAQLLASLGA